MQRFDTVTDVTNAVGQTLGPSRWFVVDKTRIDVFADVTEDRQWIHVDPVRAAAGPFGAPVAHGFLTLALSAPIMEDILHIARLGQGLNYGLDRVRFPAPVRAGERVRGRATISSSEPVPGGIQVCFALVVEVEGSQRPGCVAELLVRLYPPEDA